MLFHKINISLTKSWPFIFGLCIGLYFISLNIVGHDLSKLPGDLGDTRYCIYILEHFYQYVIGNVEYYWGAPFMVPANQVITYSENLLGVAPIFALFRFIGFDSETSLQLFYLLLVILNYSCCYLFLQHMFCNTFASVVGAMIFTFSMALQGQLYHVQTFPRFCIPLAFLFGVLFIQKFKPVYFILMFVAVVLQLFCSLYLGLMLIIPIALFFIISLLFKYKDYVSSLLKFKSVLSILIGLAVPVICLLALLKPYIIRSYKSGYYSWQLVKENIPRIESYFNSKEGSLLWDFLRETALNLPRWWNQQLFIGGVSLLFLVLFVSVLIRKIVTSDINFSSLLQKPVTIVSFAGVLTFLFFLRVGDFTLYNIIYNLPGYGSIRAVPRIINVELLFVALAAAYVIKTIIHKQNHLGWLFFIFIVALFTVDNYFIKNERSKLTKEIIQNRTNELANKLSYLPKGTTFSYEPDTMILPAHYYHLDAMLAAQKLQLKTMNGYSGTSPNAYNAYALKPNEENRLKWIQKSWFNNELVIVK